MTTATVRQTCDLPDIVDAMSGNRSSQLWFRRDGDLTSVSYDRCRADAGVLAAALRAAGAGPGTRVAIHGATSYEWVLVDLACVLSGALSVALYPHAPPARAVGTAVDAGCHIACTDRPEAVGLFRAAGLKVIFLGPDREAPAGVPTDGIPADGVPTDGVPADGIPTVGELVAADAELGIGGLERAEPRDGPFTVVSTSGTLSEPKLFAVHSSPLLYTMDRFTESYGIDGSDRLLLYLPLSHLPQRMMLYGGLRVGMDFVLSDPAHLVADTARTRPTLHVTVPRVLEHLRTRVTATLRKQGADHPPARAVAYRGLFGAEIRAIFVGSAPTEPALLTELLDAGLPLYEVYGTTELGMIGLNTPRDRRPGTVGKPIGWGDVQLDPDTGEILVRTPTPFLYGRLVDGAVVPHRWTPGAYEPTADVGAFDDDGFLSVRGRLRDFLALSSGEKVFIRPIEEAIQAECEVGLCQIVQLGGNQLGALLFAENPAAPPVPELVVRLRRVLRGLHPWERPKSFAVVHQLPTVEEGCLTETLKPRRHAIEDTYGATARWVRLTAGP